MEKLSRNLSGIANLERLPNAVFVIDTKKEHIAVTEARKLGLPVVAVVDTNCDPDIIDYVIPGNDDAIRSGSLVCRVLADAVVEGRFIAEHRRKNAPPARRGSTGTITAPVGVPAPPPPARRRPSPGIGRGDSGRDNSGRGPTRASTAVPVEAELAHVVTGTVAAEGLKMANFTAKDVQALRPSHRCRHARSAKKALEESDGDMTPQPSICESTGLAGAAKRAGARGIARSGFRRAQRRRLRPWSSCAARPTSWPKPTSSSR